MKQSKESIRCRGQGRGQGAGAGDRGVNGIRSRRGFRRDGLAIDESSSVGISGIGISGIELSTPVRGTVMREGEGVPIRVGFRQATLQALGSYDINVDNLCQRECGGRVTQH